MQKTTIRVICSDQQLVAVAAPTLASGGINEDRIEFEFCPLWDGLEKTAIFYRDKDAIFHVPLENDACIIPHEVLADEGWMYFGVFGCLDDVRRTSMILKYRVEEGAIMSGVVNPSEPMPDIYTQIFSRLDAVEQFTISPSEYEVSGASVTVSNFEGMPLHATTRIDLEQQKTGTPSSSNLRPIVGRSRADLTLNGETVCSAEFGHQVCSGSYEWDTGTLTEDMILDVFLGGEDEVITKTTHADYAKGYVFQIALRTKADPTTTARAKSRCNRAKYVENKRANYGYDTYSISADGTVLLFMPPSDVGDTIAAFRAWLAEHRVQIAYVPAEPMITSLTAQRLYAVDGENVIASSVGTVTVRGQKNIQAITADLAKRVTEMEEMGGGSSGTVVAGVSSIEGKDGDLTLDDIGAARKFDVGDGLTMADGVLSASEGVYELIETIAIEEEIGVLERTLDCLKGLFVEFTSPGVSTALGASIYVCFPDGPAYYTYGTNVIGAAKGYKSIYRAERKGNKWSLLQVYGSVNSEANPSRTMEHLRDSEDGIVKIEIYMAFPVGAIIKIWGVRA